MTSVRDFLNVIMAKRYNKNNIDHSNALLTVRYNGGESSFYGCSSHKKLIKGETYYVSKIATSSFQTDYTLIGVEGSFNSVWFDDVSVCKA